MPLKRSLSHGDNGDNDWTAQVAFTCEDPPAEKRIKQETPPPRISIRIPPHSQLQSQSRPRSPTLSAQIHHTARHRARIAPLTDTLPCHHNPAPFKHILSSIPQSNIIRIAGHLPPQPLLSDTDSLPPKQLLSDSDSLLSPSSNCPTPSSALPSPHSVLHPPPRLQVHNAQKRLFNLLHRDSLMPQPTLSERLRGLIEECISWLEACDWPYLNPTLSIAPEVRWIAVKHFRSAMHGLTVHDHLLDPVHIFTLAVAALSLALKIKNDAHKPLYMLAIEDMAVWATKELPWAITELHDGRLILKHDIVDAERLIMRSPHIHYRLSIPTPWAVLEELVFLSPTCSTLARIYPDRWHELNEQIDIQLLNLLKHDHFMHTSLAALTAAAIYEAIDDVFHFNYKTRLLQPQSYLCMFDIKQELMRLLHLSPSIFDQALVQQREVLV